jgi:threonine synthase
VDALGDAPDYHFIPVGNAGNITAYWKGFTEYNQADRSTKKPQMMGFQAEGASPIVQGRIFEHPETVATAIRIGNPASWKKAVTTRDESGGLIDSVTDEEILSAYRLLAQEEGIFGEPASAASVAGLLKVTGQGMSLKRKIVVCIITGAGLKDPDTAIECAQPPAELPAELSAVERQLGLE